MHSFTLPVRVSYLRFSPSTRNSFSSYRLARGCCTASPASSMAGSTPLCLPLSSASVAPSSPLARCRARRSPRLSSTSLSSPTPARTWPTSGRASRRRSVRRRRYLPSSSRTRSRELWRRSARRLLLLLLLLLLLFLHLPLLPPLLLPSRAYHHRRRRQPRRSVEGSPSRTSTSPTLQGRMFASSTLSH